MRDINEIIKYVKPRHLVCDCNTDGGRVTLRSCIHEALMLALTSKDYSSIELRYGEKVYIIDAGKILNELEGKG